MTMRIRIQDAKFFSKVEYLNQNTDLGEKIKKEREFIIDNVIEPSSMLILTLIIQEK